MIVDSQRHIQERIEKYEKAKTPKAKRHGYEDCGSQQYIIKCERKNKKAKEQNTEE